MDEIDSSLRVFDPKHPRLGTSHRQIDIGNDCYIILSIDPDDPKALPECHFIGSDSEVNILHGMWRRNCQRWIEDKPFAENLVNLLKIQLPGPPDEQKSEQQSECGICYAPYLPIGNLSKLSWLCLSNNKLTGTIPVSDLITCNLVWTSYLVSKTSI